MTLYAYTSAATPTPEYQVALLATTLNTMALRAPRMAGALLRRIGAGGRAGNFEIRVRPEAEGNPPGPATDALDPWNSVMQGMTFPGANQIGTGIGSSSDVFLDLQNYPRVGRAPWPADEVLYHELAHAYANMWGLRDLTLLPNAGLLDWDNMAEFMAITLTNMYRSEANAPRLRWDHNSYCHRQRVEALPISPRLQPAFDQSINERHWLTRLSWSWFGRDGGLLEAVSSFDLSFNPFERYLRARPSRTPFMGSVVPGNGVCP